MAGVHAQVMSAAEISLALRVADATRATWPRRSGRTGRWSRRSVRGGPCTSSRPPTRRGGWRHWARCPPPSGHVEGVRLTPEETDAVVAALDLAAARGRLHDRGARPARRRARADRGQPRSHAGVRRLLAAVARRRSGARRCGGVLCFGPDQGRRVAYASPSWWLSIVACRTLTRRSSVLRAYLTAYGPATPEHLARWLATSPTWTRGLFARADLDEVELGGGPAWVWRDDLTFEAGPPPVVRLLPYFDAFQVGSQPRGLLFPGRASERALARRRPATTRCCCSTASSAGSGTRSGREDGRDHRRAARPARPSAQRAALEVEVAADRGDRRGATRARRVGPISVGPHA